MDLKGYWEFYWNTLPSDNEYETLNPSKKSYIHVPGVWNNHESQSGKIPGKGYATYRLIIKNCIPGKIYSLKIPSISSSYKLLLDGKLYKQTGVFGTNEASQKPEFKPCIIFYIADEPDIKIEIPVSNYHHSRSGMWETPKFGTAGSIQKMEKLRMLYIDFLIGALLIICIYHIGLFIFLKKDYSTLYFAVFCFIVLVRIIFTEERLHNDLFPFLSWDINIKIEYLTLVIPSSVFYMFLRSLFPEFYNRLILNISLLLTAVFTMGIIMLPPYIFTGMLIIFQVYIISICLLMFSVLIKAVIRRTENALFVLTGGIILFASAVNDILFSQYIIPGIQLLSFGLFAFTVIQSLILAKRFSKAFSEKEKAQMESIKNHELALINKQEAIDNLKQADKFKDEFLANTSHELRTPLNGIIGFSEFLIDDKTSALPDETINILKIISSSAKRLSSLINDILDFSKMKNNEITVNKSDVKLKTIADMAINITLPLINDKKIRIHNNIPEDIPHVYADELRLEQILLNLIGNSIKFTDHGKIELNAKIREKMIEISVMDTGIGIPENKFDEIFLSFQQLDMTNAKKYAGTGIGLSITKKLVELHGGTIWLESHLGKGTIFYFTVPVVNGELGRLNVDKNGTLSDT